MKVTSIWIISQNSYAPYMNAGTRHYGMGREWVKSGISTRIFTSSFNHKTLRETRTFRPFQAYQLEVIDGVEFVWIRTWPYRKNDGLDRVFSMLLFSLTVFTITLMSPRFKKPNVVIGSSPTLLPAYAASLVSWILRIPFVFEIRDLWPQTIIEFHPSKKNHPLIRFFFRVERFCLDRASRIAGLLPGITDYLDTKDVSLKKCFFWLPNGVDEEHAHKPVTARETCTRVVYAGALSKANAMESLIETAALCPEFSFHLYGSGTEKSELQEKSEQLGLRNITFHDPVPKAEVFTILEDADILIATLKDTDLYKYGISLNKLYDYLAVGKPIVFGVRSFNDPVHEAKAGLSVAPENPQALADGLREVASWSREKRLQTGHRAKTYLLNNHTYAILAERLVNQVESISK